MAKLATSFESKNNSKLDGGLAPKLAALSPNVSLISGKYFENFRTRLLGDVLSETLLLTKMIQQKSMFFVPLEYIIWRARLVRGHFSRRIDVTLMLLTNSVSEPASKASEIDQRAGCRNPGGPLGVPLEAYAQMMPSGRIW